MAKYNNCSNDIKELAKMEESIEKVIVTYANGDISEFSAQANGSCTANIFQKCPTSPRSR